VVLIKTISPREGLVNGARGVVVGFSGERKHPLVKFAHGGKEIVVRRETWSVRNGGRTIATRTQLPLELAWALSIHKSQVRVRDRSS
jgi:ATP-dependent DNA helicase PIF1